MIQNAIRKTSPALLNLRTSCQTGLFTQKRLVAEKKVLERSSIQSAIEKKMKELNEKLSGIQKKNSLPKKQIDKTTNASTSKQVQEHVHVVGPQKNAGQGVEHKTPKSVVKEFVFIQEPKIPVSDDEEHLDSQVDFEKQSDISGSSPETNQPQSTQAVTPLVQPLTIDDPGTNETNQSRLNNGMKTPYNPRLT